MKILKKSTFFLENIRPQMLLFCIFWCTVDPYLCIFLAKNWILNILVFFPTIQSMFPLFNLKQGGKARFSTGKFYFFFCNGNIHGIHSHGCGGKRFLGCVCQIYTPYCTVKSPRRPSSWLSRLVPKRTPPSMPPVKCSL